MPSFRTRRRRSKAAKRYRQRLQRQQPRPPRKGKHWRRILTVSVAVVGLISALVGIDAYASFRLSVASITTLDPLRPFQTRFTLSNDSYLTMRNVDLTCVIPIVQYEHDTTSSQIMVRDTNVVPSIPPGSRITVVCKHDSLVGITNPIIRAEMLITLTYQPSYLPFRRARSISFVTAKDSSGNLHWVEQPAG